ncbi:MAG: hypothetical protein JNL43_13280 [Flavobacteriales bacterium]|nr:hypothetical protein [Flavobacteriales bacterium]
MDDPSAPTPDPKVQPPSKMELGTRPPMSIPSDEDLAYDLTEEYGDESGTDPEHSRSLARVRTELLRRAQRRAPNE